jgi:hypothetical protein
MPLRLSQLQLDQIMQTAEPLPRDLRSKFLHAVAARLPPEPGDGQVFLVCKQVAKEIRWLSMKAAI